MAGTILKPIDRSPTLTTKEVARTSSELSRSKAFAHRIRVGWADCDPALIVYTGRIPYFALESIDAWWGRHVGHDWYRLNLDRSIGTPFVHLSLDFRSPVTPRFPLDCTVRLVMLRDTSVGFEVTGEQNDITCFQGKFVCVFVNAKSFKKMSPPPDIRAAISSLLEEAASEPSHIKLKAK